MWGSITFFSLFVLLQRFYFSLFCWSLSPSLSLSIFIYLSLACLCIMYAFFVRRLFMIKLWKCQHESFIVCKHIKQQGRIKFFLSFFIFVHQKYYFNATKSGMKRERKREKRKQMTKNRNLFIRITWILWELIFKHCTLQWKWNALKLCTVQS